MPLKRSLLKPVGGKEIPISILEIDRREEMLWISGEKALQDSFPPCIHNILQRTGEEPGRHRKGAILASFLGQVGWGMPESRAIWLRATGGDEKIFSKWFGAMHCPKCATIKKQSKGYPDLGMAELGICAPDERCVKYEGPVEYACDLQSETDLCRGTQRPIKTYYRIRFFDWSRGREAEIELSEAEHRVLEEVMKELSLRADRSLAYTWVRVRGRLRPRFLLQDRRGPRRQMLSDML